MNRNKHITQIGYYLKQHILSVHEWKKSIKCYSILMYLRQHLRRKHHILDWIYIISAHEGKKFLKNEQKYYLKQYILSFHGWKSPSNVTLHWCIHVNICDESIIFLIEYTLYQFMKEKSRSNVTLPWCIHTNIWDESIIFLIDSRPSSTHFDTEASRRFLVRYLTTHNTSDFTDRFLDQKFC